MTDETKSNANAVRWREFERSYEAIRTPLNENKRTRLQSHLQRVGICELEELLDNVAQF